MTEKEIKRLINLELKNFFIDNLDKEVSKLLHDNTKSRGEMIDSVRNAFDSVYRSLWQKRDFWASGIK
jgi:hypothetical protein